MSTGYKFTELTGGGIESLDSIDGYKLEDGDVAFVFKRDENLFYPYILDDDSGLNESVPDIIEPDTNPNNKRWILQRTAVSTGVAPGCIFPWLGGFFTDTGNIGYTHVLGDSESIADCNSYLIDYGFVICDGTEYYNEKSPIYNGTGRYLPYLLDDRFICGGDSYNIGTTGGVNSYMHSHPFIHTHEVKIENLATNPHILTEEEIPSHSHTLYFYDSTDSISEKMPQGYAQANNDDTNYSSAGNAIGEYGGTSPAHNHSIPDVSYFTEANITENTENVTLDNKPKYLRTYYIIRVI